MARLLLTRPAEASERFVQLLHERGLRFEQVLYSPLMQIVATGEAADLAGAAGVIFTSAQAVTLAPAGQGRQAYVVGPSTGAAAAAAGYQVLAVAADAEALFQRILADPPGGALMHLRGVHSRGDLAARLSRAGVTTGEQVIYDQVEAELNGAAKTLLMERETVILPLFSPRSAAIFAQQCQGNASLRVAAISAATADALSGLVVQRLEIAHTPDAEAMVAAVQRLMDAGNSLEGEKPRQ